MAMKRLFIASSLLALSATSTLLSGCGEDNTTPGATASPSSETPGTVTTASYLAAVRNTTTPGATEDTVAAVLSLVDDATGTEVTTTPIDAYGSPKLAQAFTVAADGKSYQAGRQTKAYYVYQHKLYEISLEHTSNVLDKPVARQVSSETHACKLSQVIERDASAQTSYLSYTSGGADGDCSTLNDNEVKTALSSSDATTATGPAYVDVLRDSAGLVTRFVGVDASHKLVIVDASTLAPTNVLNGTLPVSTSTDVNSVTTSTYPSVSVFGKVAGTRDKVYLRVGQDVRTLDWSTGTLSATAVATLNLNQAPLVHTDEDATYYVDMIPAVAPAAAAAIAVVTPDPVATAELVLMRIKPGQNAEMLASLGVDSVDQMPAVATHAMTPSSLAMVIRRNSGDTLSIVSKDGNNKRDVPLIGPASRVGIQAHAGEVLVVSQQLNTGEDASALTRVDLGNSDSLLPLSASASLVTVINGGSMTIGGEVPSSYLLWNEPGTLASRTVRSHNLGGNNTLIIANNSTLAGWNGGTLSAAVSNLTVGLLRGLTTSTPNAETLWLFNATKAVGAN